MPETQPAPRLVVELTNICNLHCGYCVRDDEALHHAKPSHLPPAFIDRLLGEAADAGFTKHVAFTGGEVALHPGFDDIVAAVARRGFRFSFVTNGWHFERLWPVLRQHQDAVREVSFSVDGPDAASHDRWRGKGSFARVAKAFALCHRGGIRFAVKATIRQDTLPQLEAIALMAARFGAAETRFAHLLPTSRGAEADLALTRDERRRAEEELAVLRRILQMRVTLAVGYENVDPAPPCLPLQGLECNVDYKGRLTLCCNLSGFRGAGGERDVAADLMQEGLASAFVRLQSNVVAPQLARRREALAAAPTVDPSVASPCLFCLTSFDKVPWRNSALEAHR